MKKWYGALAGFAVAVLLASVSAAPVLAHEGHDDDTSSNSGRSSVQHRDDGEGDDVSDDQVKLTAMTAEDRQKLRDRAEERLEKIKAQREERQQERTDQERERRCRVVKQGLQKKVERLSTNAQKHLEHINSVLDKAQKYQTTAGVSGAEVDAALAAAQSAQSDATAAVEALKDLEPTIDCNKDSVASDVATFREAAADTRAKLQTYRQAVKDLIVELKKATPVKAEDDSTTTEDGNE